MRSALIDAIRRTTIDRLERPGGFDAVVVGAGAAGGLAAERLTRGGLDVLLLDAGFRPSWPAAPYRRLTAAMVSRLADPDLLPWLPPGLLYRGRRAVRLLGRVRQPVQTECHAWERRPDAFVDDLDCPYTTAPERPYLWVRARALQGRVGIPGHGRLYFRLGPDDFAPWPFGAGELDQWYADVERRLGMAGTRDGLRWLPDSEIARTLVPTAAEADLMARIKARWPASCPILGRSAPPADTLEAAAASLRLSVRQGAIVRAVEVERGRARGVRWIDQASGRERIAAAPLVFLCASALESTRILMLSRDAASGRGLGAGSDALGRHLMDHVTVKAEGIGGRLPGPPVTPFEDGRCVYLPRFDARDAAAVPPAGQGFGVQVYRATIARGRSSFVAVTFGEMAAGRENRVVLHPRRTDRWGIPILHIDCAMGEPERRLAADQTAALRMLADIAGVSLHRIDTAAQPPGSALHECGTARMGRDPAASVLDPHNQCWDAAGLYVTDGAAFPAQGSQNPTLTIMALTARACAHALRQTNRDRTVACAAPHPVPRHAGEGWGGGDATARTARPIVRHAQTDR